MIGGGLDLPNFQNLANLADARAKLNLPCAKGKGYLTVNSVEAINGSPSEVSPSILTTYGPGISPV